MDSIIPQPEDLSDPVEPFLGSFLDEFGANGKGRPRADVTVSRSGKWFVLRGWVQSTRLKSKLISTVPSVHGTQYIVDRVRVGSN